MMVAGDRLHLDSDDQRFLAGASALIMANPFEITRQQVAALVPTSALISIGDHHAITALLPELTTRLDRLNQRNAGSLAQYVGEERQWLADAWLFRGYHRFLPELDRLIERELAHPGQPATVSFAGEVLSLLREQGFDEAEATRYLGLFYQLRRAYHFIGGDLIGSSPCMKELRRALWNNVFGRDIRVYDRYLWNRMEDFSTLLLGETGSGKGSAAAAIGRSVYIPFDPASKRFQHRFTDTFIAVNLAEFPESLIESELFGHRKGAFTGAVEDHQGVFARCSPCGSLFLDEIGDMSLSAQAKVLRALQENRITRVGGEKDIKVNVRILAATNKDLRKEIENNNFREDLYHRLSVILIHVPALNDRKDDIPLLVEHFSKLICEEQGMPVRSFDKGALKALQELNWTGNIRELRNVVERLLILGGKSISEADVKAYAVPRHG